MKAEDSIEPEDWELVSPGARQVRQVRGKVIGLYGGLCRYSAHVPPEDTVATQYSVRDRKMAQGSQGFLGLGLNSYKHLGLGVLNIVSQPVHSFEL